MPVVVAPESVVPVAVVPVAAVPVAVEPVAVESVAAVPAAVGTGGIEVPKFVGSASVVRRGVIIVVLNDQL